MSCCGRGEALWPWAAPGRTAALCLDRLNLEPLQLEELLQVLLQGPYWLGPGGTTTLCMQKHCQLSQTPTVKGRRKKVWVTVAGFLVLIFITHCPMGSRKVWGKVARVDDLCPEVEMGRGAGSAWGGQNWKPFRVRQITGTVCVIILVIVVLLECLRSGSRGVHQGLRRHLPYS